MPETIDRRLMHSASAAVPTWQSLLVASEGLTEKHEGNRCDCGAPAVVDLARLWVVGTQHGCPGDGARAEAIQCRSPCPDSKVHCLSPSLTTPGAHFPSMAMF